jgi:putative transcription factor
MSKKGFDHQDWDTVVLRKSAKQLKKQNSNKNNDKRVSNKKPNSNKLETKKIVADDGEVNALDKVSHSLKIQIQKARNAKGLTQKELAIKLQLPVTTIRDYENGKAIPNGALISKIGRKLGVKFTKD